MAPSRKSSWKENTNNATGYGLAPGEWKAVSRKLHAKGKKARENGKAKRFTGNIEDAL
jgi:hypothetical protein